MPSAKITLADCAIDASAPLADIYALLALRGGIVVKGAFSVEDTLKMRAELQPHIDERAKLDSKKAYTGAFFPTSTIKVGGLIGRSDTFARKMVPHPIFHGLAKMVLERRDRMPLAPGGAFKWTTAAPDVNVTTVLQIHPGAAAQTLHRDDVLFHPHRPAVSTWDRLRENTTLNFVALDKVTARNGGTLFVPGSHCLAETDPIPDVADALSIEAEVGDAIVILCSPYHAGGANVCAPGEPDSVRTLAALGYKIGYLRQEENQYLANDHEVMKKLPIEVQSLAGWGIALPMSGWVEFETPLNLLGHNIPGGDSTFWDAEQDE